jgi:hypothetical protein
MDWKYYSRDGKLCLNSSTYFLFEY